MSPYKLQPGETLVTSVEGMRRDRALIRRYGDLLLTDSRVVWVEKGITGDVLRDESYPLSEVQLKKERPRVSVKCHEQDDSLLKIVLSDRTLKFYFDSLDDDAVRDFTTSLDKMISNRDRRPDGAAIQSPRTRNQAPPSQAKTRGKCAFCGAPLRATAGKTVRCPYCGGEQLWRPDASA